MDKNKFKPAKNTGKDYTTNNYNLGEEFARELNSDTSKKDTSSDLKTTSSQNIKSRNDNKK